MSTLTSTLYTLSPIWPHRGAPALAERSVRQTGQPPEPEPVAFEPSNPRAIGDVVTASRLQLNAKRLAGTFSHRGSETRAILAEDIRAIREAWRQWRAGEIELADVSTLVVVG